MPKKHQKKNPFILFCTERQQTDPSLAGKNLQELVGLCAEPWQALGPERKQRYVNMAKEWNATGGLMRVAPDEDDLTGKFDSLGRSLLALKEQERIEKFWVDAIRRDIRMRIDKARSTGSLAKMVIHVMGINTWLELNPVATAVTGGGGGGGGGGDGSSGEEGVVLPAEVGLVQMSVLNGVTERYNQMVNPGQLPVGYKADARINSEKYHQIWLDNELLSDSYNAIVENLRGALTVGKDCESYAGEEADFEYMCGHDNVPFSAAASSAKRLKLVPVYVMPADKDRTVRGLRWLCKKAKVDYEFAVYDLAFFFWKLIESAPYELPKKLSLNLAEAELKRDVFLYVNGVSCQHHTEIESCACAGAKASRLAFILCDFGCQLLGQRPVEGRHVPNGIDVDHVIDDIMSFSHQASSFYSSSAATRGDFRHRLELETVPKENGKMAKAKDGAAGVGTTATSSDKKPGFSKSHILSTLLRRRQTTTGGTAEGFEAKTEEEIFGGGKSNDQMLADLPPEVLSQLDVSDLTMADTTYYSVAGDTTNPTGEGGGRRISAAALKRPQLGGRAGANNTTHNNHSFVSAADTVPEK